MITKFRIFENNDINWTLIGDIQYDNKVAKVKKALDNGADINFRDIDRDGMTPLMHAIEKFRYRIIDYLIERGADINLQDDEGRTALMHAGEVHSFDILQTLLEAGAEWYIKDNYGYDFFYYTTGEYADMIKEDYPEEYKEYLMKKDAEKYNI